MLHGFKVYSPTTQRPLMFKDVHQTTVVILRSLEFRLQNQVNHQSLNGLERLGKGDQIKVGRDSRPFMLVDFDEVDVRQKSTMYRETITGFASSSCK